MSISSQPEISVNTNPGRRAVSVRKLLEIEGATVFAALILLVAFSSAFAPGFLSPGNLTNVLVQSVFVVILGIGMTFVLVAGGIDLSVGSTMGLAAALTIYSINHAIPVPLAILIGLASGAAVGLFNSYFIMVLKMADFIVTLGTLSLVRGIVELMTANSRLTTQSEAFGFLTGGTILGVPMAVLLAAAVVVGGGLTLAKTAMGRRTYAVGLNAASSYLAGVRVRRVRVGVYVASGTLAALAGILLGSRLSSAHPALGTGYELTAIAAAAIGGTSLAGGRGSVLGTILGALLLGVLQNSLSLLQVNAFWFQIITGLMIVAAVLLDGAIRRMLRARPSQ
ncbi:MAG TPA: ABC transporter permease [Chthoniobacterales bacterium]